jgi:uncharacterized protein YqjF (DUF2071 family)
MTTALATRGPRLTDVVSTLRGFAITTYDVPIDVLAACLPNELTPYSVTLDDGRERGLVSAVTFRNEQFHVGFAPFIELVAEQTNFRAYVQDEGVDAVYFFGTTLGSRFVFMPRFFWKLPWAYGRHETTFDFDGPGNGCSTYRFVAQSAHGEERLEATGTSIPMGRLDGFVDEATTARVLTHPTVGYVRRTDGRYATYGVDHEPLALERATPRVARFELFERLGLIARDAVPHSVLVLPETRFIVRLPPRRVPFTARRGNV